MLTFGVIRSFRDTATRDLFNGISSKQARKIPPEIWHVARRKLDMLNAAARLDDLRIPPANRLEARKGDRKGFFSIRINSQYRVVFRWNEGFADEVEIVDYH